MSTYSVCIHKVVTFSKLTLPLDDSILQEIIYQLSKIPKTPVHADIVVNAESDSTLDIQDICAFTTAIELIYSLALLIAR